MSLHLHITSPEKCAICGKPIHLRKGRAVIFYFNKDVVGGSWHAKCGPLPRVEGLTAPAPK